MTLATKITLSRIVLIIPTTVLFILAYSILRYQTHLLIATAILFVLLCTTDILDGAVARRTNTVSDLGKFLDPLADKIVAVVLMFLISWQSQTLYLNEMPYGPVIFVLASALIVARELVIGIFRAIASQKGIVIAADRLGKIKTNVLNISLTILIFAPLYPLFSWVGQIGFIASSVLAVISGVRYIVKNKSIIVTQDDYERNAE